MSTDRVSSKRSLVDTSITRCRKICENRRFRRKKFRGISQIARSFLRRQEPSSREIIDFEVERASELALRESALDLLYSSIDCIIDTRERIKEVSFTPKIAPFSVIYIYIYLSLLDRQHVQVEDKVPNVFAIN